MIGLVTTLPPKEPNKCFKITYLSDIEELVIADSMGVTEDLQTFITFYTENNFNDDLVCMINQSTIKKIETIIAPKETK